MSAKFEFIVFLSHDALTSAVYAVIVCQCGVDVAYQQLSGLAGSGLDIAQLAHAAGKSIVCHEGWLCGSS